MHLNRADPRATTRTCIFLAGPGHGGPALVANVYLEGTYSEIYPAHHARRARACAALPPVLDARRHPEPRRPADAGLDPRGRRARLRARARVRRRVRQPRPDRGRGGRRRRGRDRAARGLVEGHPLPQPRARRRGAADPAPQRLQDRRARRCSAARATTTIAQPARGPRLRRALRRGRRSAARCTTRSPTTLDACLRADPRDPARRRGRAASRGAPRWPAIVLRTPKGWTGPKVVDGVPVEGTFRAHQVPLADVRDEPRAPRDARGVDAQLPARRAVRRARPPRRRRSRALAPTGERRMGANPHANGGATRARRSTCPTHARYAVDGRRARRRRCTSRRAQLGELLRDVYRDEPDDVPALLPRRDQLEPARRGVRGREPLLRWSRRSPTTTTCPPTAA